MGADLGAVSAAGHGAPAAVAGRGAVQEAQCAAVRSTDAYAWGSEGLPTLEIWRAYADDVTGAEIPECGHFIPEEQPVTLLAHLRPFLAGKANR
jgi:pimeloyl-ACP methyl ester carboxylesterase